MNRVVQFSEGDGSEPKSHLRVEWKWKLKIAKITI